MATIISLSLAYEAFFVLLNDTMFCLACKVFNCSMCMFSVQSCLNQVEFKCETRNVCKGPSGCFVCRLWRLSICRTHQDAFVVVLPNSKYIQDFCSYKSNVVHESLFSHFSLCLFSSSHIKHFCLFRTPWMHALFRSLLAPTSTRFGGHHL